MDRGDVLIIGAGVVGAAIARELSCYRLRVMLVEKEPDVSFGASKANSGIVHSGLHDQPGTLRARLCVRGNLLYDSLAAELNFLYRRNGSLVVARGIEEMNRLDELIRQGRQNGVSGLELVNGADLGRLEPNLNPGLAGGLLAPTGGIVIPFDLVFALVENAVANGVELRLNTEVIGVQKQRDGFMIETNKGLIEADFVINAAGLASGSVSRLLGDESVTIQPVLGEEYLMDRRLAGLIRRTIFPLPTALSKGILVMPTVEGNLMIGPTARRVERASEPETSAAGWEEIFGEAKSLVPRLNPSDLITSFAGLRATSDREDFIIEASALHPHWIQAAGINSPGLTAAPAIAEYVRELLHESGLRLAAKPDFNPVRKLVRLRELDREQQAALMSGDPGYARIVCRCETVSEAEIRQAIRRGAATLDGVKLRTRSGMGRCQGGFCTPKIIRILSEELGIAPEQITKNGPGSPLLTGRLREEESE
jgi:glycerol-3-phosphate dehydrogenase